ncbi:MAG: AraC family transcriptional regulator [Polyangiaceae bacterium]|nr:AraC family transcriptional regulator [Polyangiaceae bacterium]
MNTDAIDATRLAAVQRLVGGVTAAELQHVDFVVSERVGLFFPVTGPCGYARIPLHTHPAYSFVVNFDDRCRTRIDGRVLGGRAGRVIAFSPGVPHEELPSTETPSYAAVCVEPRFFESVAEHHPALRGRELRGLEAPTGPGLLGCIRRLVAEHELPGVGSREVIAAREVELVHLALRELAVTAGVAPVADGGNRPLLTDRLRVAASVHFAHARFHQRLTVRDLARAARLSPAHLSRLWKKEFGQSPMEYVMELRLEAARRRLVASDEPLTTIAIECGFGSSSYFSHCFGRRYQLAPSEYRRTRGA